MRTSYACASRDGTKRTYRHKNHVASAFTIVELLIVIVVIGILAAISIVSYTGITQNARDSSAKATAQQIATKVELSYINDGAYPSSLSSIGISDSNGTTYQYRVTSDTWCATVTVGSASYYVSDTTAAPTKGGCPGHGQGGVAAITNLAANPSVEVNPLSLNNGGGATAQRTTAEKHSGSTSMLLTKGSGYSFLNTSPGQSMGVSGDVITVSAWIKSSASNVYLVKRGSGVAYGAIAKGVTPNQWARIAQSYTVDAGATSFYVDVGWESGQAAAGSTLYVDDIMVTSGSTLYNYADGNSQNWIWNGTANASTSTGPAL